MSHKLLLTDDEPVVLASLVEQLRDERPELEVLTADSGAQALEILRAQAVTVLVTDLMMPELDGLELLATIINEHLQVSVAVMTGLGTQDQGSRALSMGAIAVLEKPFPIAELLTAVGPLLNDQEGELRGISVTGFLQLLEAERKSCLLRIRSGANEGTMVFENGALVDARVGQCVGKVAAFKLASWPGAEIHLESPPPNFEHTVEISLTHLLLESARLADEKAMAEALATPDAPKKPEPTPDLRAHSEGVKNLMERLEHIRRFSAAAFVIEGTGESLYSVGTVGTASAAQAAVQWAATLDREAWQNADHENGLRAMIITTSSGRHFIHPVPGLGLLYLVIEQQGWNMALAWREIETLTEQIQDLLTET